MQELLSIWLVPSRSDEEYLTKIIHDLGANYNAPIFTPHLTLFDGIIIEPEALKSIVDDVFQNVQPFKIKVKGINESEAFFKTVFIEFELGNELETLFNAVSGKTDKRPFSVFKPHISLIYKIMPREEKLRIIENLNIKDEFEIDKVVINAPRINEKDFMDIEGWHSLYEKTLGGSL